MGSAAYHVPSQCTTPNGLHFWLSALESVSEAAIRTIRTVKLISNGELMNLIVVCCNERCEIGGANRTSVREIYIT